MHQKLIKLVLCFFKHRTVVIVSPTVFMIPSLKKEDWLQECHMENLVKAHLTADCIAGNHVQFQEMF
jgi:hypothetical protein